MQTLQSALEQAQHDGVAIGHFNVADSVQLNAVFRAAQDLNVPVIVGVSEGERDFIGLRQIAALVRSLREEFDFPIFLDADHTHSLLHALKRVATPDELAQAALYLASDASSFQTGTAMLVDGGLSITRT